MPGSSAAAGRDVGQWIDAARSGSAEAMEKLIAACRGYLLLVANGELEGNADARLAASDLVQETLVKLQQEIGTFRGTGEGELLAWLRRILLNHLSTQKRKRGDAMRHSVPLGTPGDSHAGTCRPSIEPADLHATPCSQALAEEQSQVLRKAMERLPEHYRQVVQLRNWDRLSFEEIGQRLGRSAEAIRKLWARAIEHMQQELESLDGRE